MKNKKYLQLIDKLISIKDKNIDIKYLDSYNIIQSKYLNEIFRINQDGTIYFLHHQNLIKFDFKKENLTPKTRIILNINIKNQQCYELIQTIIKLQSKFIHSNNKQNLKYFSHKDILKYHQINFNTSLVSSNISTISHNTFYRDKNNNVFKLNYLLPKKHFIIYLKCRYILNHHINMTDIQLSHYLKKHYNITTTKSKIYEIRKKYLIPNKNNRKLNIYFEYEKNYLPTYKLNVENLKVFKNIDAIYELLSINENKYNYKNSKTIYIGSTNDTQKRLTSYMNGFAHTKKLRIFIDKNQIFFRIIKTENYRDLEKDILEAFYATFGEYPMLNTNRVL